MNLEYIKENFLKKIDIIENNQKLQELKVEFLGKKSEISELLKNMGSLSIDDKKIMGPKINEVRNFITEQIKNKEEYFQEQEIIKNLNLETLDITIPCRSEEKCSIHPLSKVQNELEQIFISMGFSITDGPEIEDDWHCFEALNVPKHHPARQMQDTFYLKDYNNDKIVLRTQTTSIQSREMETNKPPFKFIVSGSTYRSEADATHCPMFHQMDGVYIDKCINMQDLKDCLTTFCKKYFNLNDVPLRFRPSYFPFTTPSIEIDIKCSKEQGKLILGKGEDWMEILGAGMIHPNVMKNMNIDSNEYQGFAFGIGIERMAMLKYGIRDMRNLYDGDIRFLREYGFNILK